MFPSKYKKGREAAMIHYAIYLALRANILLEYSCILYMWCYSLFCYLKILHLKMIKIEAPMFVILCNINQNK